MPSLTSSRIMSQRPLRLLQVEARRGLVEEQHRRPRHQRGGDVEPPSHPAGVRPDGRSAASVRSNRSSSSAALGGMADVRHLGQQADQPQVLPAGEVRIDGRELAGEPDPAPDRVRLSATSCPRTAARPAVGLEHGREDPDRRRLARAVRSEEAEHRPRRAPEKSMPSRATTSPNRFVSPSTSIAASVTRATLPQIVE